jgi:hypothetical protein
VKTTRALIVCTALATAPLLSGCLTTLAMKGMNGPGACPADIVPLASSNMYALQSASPGQPLSVLPEPQEKERIPLQGGESSVEIWYYRTGHELCRNLPTEQPFTMVLVDIQRGSILGIGQQAIAAYRPYMQHGPTYAPQDTGDILQDFNPFS